jgi:hypothetical protein
MSQFGLAKSAADSPSGQWGKRWFQQKIFMLVLPSPINDENCYGFFY